MNKQKRVLNGKCTIKPKLVVWDMQSIPLSLPSSSHQLLTLSVSNIACSSAADLHDVAHSAVLSFQLLHTLLHSCVGNYLHLPSYQAQYLVFYIILLIQLRYRWNSGQGIHQRVTACYQIRGNLQHPYNFQCSITSGVRFTTTIQVLNYLPEEKILIGELVESQPRNNILESFS